MHNMHMWVARAGAALVIAALVLSFFFVWPGVWRYEYFCFQNPIRRGAESDGPFCYRVDRITGKFQSYDIEGWH
jgi:hypothetical protein